MCTDLNNAINLPQKQVEKIKDLKNEADRLLQGLSD